MKKLWIVLTAHGLFATNWTKKSQSPNIHGVYGSEEQMLQHAGDYGPPKRWFDTDIYTWGSDNDKDGVRFWAIPFSASVQELRTALGQQWFAPKLKEPQLQQTVCVALSDDTIPIEGIYLGDGVFQMGGPEDLRSESVIAWRPLPEKGEAWPVLPPSYQVKSS